MARLTSDWTDRHLSVAAAMLTAALAGALAMLADHPYGLVGLAVVALTLLVALSLDAFGGIVAGFVGAAVVIAARQAGGAWTPDTFGLSLSVSVALVVLGWRTGTLSAGLRTRRGEDTSASGSPAAAEGSLGLLTADHALARLDEEVVRARRHRRPLTVVLVQTEITDPQLPADARRIARRTVARLVEGLVPETAVPFALEEDVVGAVLPETDEASAWELLGPVVDAAARASFAVRQEGERRSLIDCAELHAGLTTLSPQHADADALLADVRRTVAAERSPRPVEGKELKE